MSTTEVKGAEDGRGGGGVDTKPISFGDSLPIDLGDNAKVLKWGSVRLPAECFDKTRDRGIVDVFLNLLAKAQICTEHLTGRGQKLRTGSLVLPVADNIFK